MTSTELIVVTQAADLANIPTTTADVFIILNRNLTVVNGQLPFPQTPINGVAKWKASMTWTGFRGKHTEETKKKISESKKGCKGVRNKPIICEATLVTYDSIKEAAKAIGMKEGTLAMQLRGCNPNKTTLKYR